MKMLALSDTIVEPLIGGCLIGLGSIIALAAVGKVPGLSGVVAKIIRPKAGDVLWRVVFVLGVIAGAATMFLVNSNWKNFTIPGGRGLIAVGVAGFLVGFGARLGGGCTSGHGVCGIGAGAKDAVVYTMIFMAAGAVTVFVWNLLA